MIDGKCMMVGMVQYTYSQAQVKMGWLVLKTCHLISPIFFVSAGTLALIHCLHQPLTFCQLYYPSCDRPCSLLLFYDVFGRPLFSFFLFAMSLQCSPSLIHCQLELILLCFVFFFTFLGGGQFSWIITFCSFVGM